MEDGGRGGRGIRQAFPPLSLSLSSWCVTNSDPCPVHLGPATRDLAPLEGEEDGLALWCVVL
jgi:hypothetical protein